jgi:hypothetical protein
MLLTCIILHPFLFLSNMALCHILFTHSSADEHLEFPMSCFCFCFCGRGEDYNEQYCQQTFIREYYIGMFSFLLGKNW